MWSSDSEVPRCKLILLKASSINVSGRYVALQGMHFFYFYYFKTYKLPLQNAKINTEIRYFKQTASALTGGTKVVHDEIYFNIKKTKCLHLVYKLYKMEDLYKNLCLQTFRKN